mmetsp:Transcript_14228/g.17889  ORF Transcript_14228/g.17889 Transcript_14228/m.17889 type:complete len:90 (-) Transcript_14228:646-915(-)
MKAWEIVLWSSLAFGLLIAAVILFVKFTSPDEDDGKKVFEEDIKWEVEDYEKDLPPDPIFRIMDNKECREMIFDKHDRALEFFNFQKNK